MTNTLRPFLVPLALALLAMLFGHGLGIAFGAVEESIHAGLQSRADAVLADVYGGDVEKAKSVVAKSWTYMKRAHMHSGALGTAGLVISLLMAFLGGPWLRLRQAAALASTVGGLGYGIFWLVAAYAAPGRGGTGAAKEAYAWLAMPSSGLVVAGVVGSLGLVVAALVRRPDAAPSAAS